VGDKVTVGSIVIRIQHTVSKATDAVERITASYLPVGGGEDGAGVGEADAVGGVAVGVAVSAVVGMAVGVVVGAVVDVAVGAEVGNVVGVDVWVADGLSVGVVVGAEVGKAVGVLAETGDDELGDEVGPGVVGTVTPDTAFTFFNVGSLDALKVEINARRSCSVSKGAVAKDSGVMFVSVGVYTMIWVYSTTTLPSCNWRCPCINFWVNETSVPWMVVSKFETRPLASMEDLMNDSVNSSHEVCAVLGNVVIPDKVIVSPSKVTVVTDGIGDTLLVLFVVGAFVSLTVGALVFLTTPTVVLVVLARPLDGAFVDFTVRAFVSFAAEDLPSSRTFGRKIRKASLWPVWSPTKSFCCKAAPSLSPLLLLDSIIVVITGTCLYRNLL
jgi:hypothetical protein